MAKIDQPDVSGRRPLKNPSKCVLRSRRKKKAKQQNQSDAA